MRIDKYLKVARILKRRAIAKELADNDRVLINDKIAKASASIKVDDTITVIFGNRSLKVRVLKLAEFAKKEESSELFEVVEEIRDINNAHSE